MIVSLDEMKQYLRVDFQDDDEFLSNALQSAEMLCADVARLYAGDLAYLYEHREDADHHDLTLSLRSLLFGIRKEGF